MKYDQRGDLLWSPPEIRGTESRALKAKKMGEPPPEIRGPRPNGPGRARRDRRSARAYDQSRTRRHAPPGGGIVGHRRLPFLLRSTDVDATLHVPSDRDSTGSSRNTSINKRSSGTLVICIIRFRHRVLRTSSDKAGQLPSPSSRKNGLRISSLSQYPEACMASTSGLA
jgi:hypothetical protein